MAYTVINFKTKKAVKEAMKTISVRVYQPNDRLNIGTPNGTCYLEGPHYPKPHRWYATAQIKDNIILSIK